MNEEKPQYLGFKSIMYEGSEAFTLDLQPLTQISDLILGQEYLVRFCNIYLRMKIIQLDGNKATAEDSNTSVWLHWDRDERHTWTTGPLLDKRAVARINLI
jgi:hypothetical protein